jgi:poly(beta-D-mannuronate) lyase
MVRADAMMLRTIVVAFALGALQTSGSTAVERRVENNQEFTAAMRQSRPGDVIVLRDGEWADVELVFDAQGAAERPITLRAQTPGKAVLTGQSRLRLGGEHLVVEGLWFKDGQVASGDVIAFRRSSSRLALHCRLTQCAVTGYSPAERKSDTKWVSIYGSHNRVDHCYLADKTNSGPTLVVWVGETPNHHQIDHNHFGPRPSLGANGGETIRVGTSDVSLNNSRTVVEHNLFEACDGEIEIISNKSCENVYRYNTFRECQGALTLRHGDRCTVAGNFFLGHGRRSTGGVRIIGEDHKVYNNYFAELVGIDARAPLCLMNGLPNSPLHGYFQVQRAMVAFNTFVHCRQNFVLGFASDNPRGGVLPPKDCVFAHNIVLGKKEPLINEISTPINLRWQGNLMYGAPLGVSENPGILTMDPLLQQADEGLWRPNRNSPAIGQGTEAFPFVQEDMDGQRRTGRPDIGCDQVSAEPVVRRPLTASDVGPAWRSR